MLEKLLSGAGYYIGYGMKGSDLHSDQIVLRTILVYLLSLVIVRMADKRFLGRRSAFDIIVAVILGSIISRAINGSANILSSLIVCATLIFVHWLLAVIATYSPKFSLLVKGKSVELIRDGEMDTNAMRKTHTDRIDLDGALRLNGQVRHPKEVQIAVLEDNGEISVIPQHVLLVKNIKVENGVQTIQIELSTNE